MNLSHILLAILMAGLLTGGTFTCKSGDDNHHHVGMFK